VAFTITATPATHDGFRDVEDGWSVRIDRALLAFKTMTIGKVGEVGRCAYRGRGAANDMVFDARSGLVQTFNGVEPGDCPDVGIVLGAVGNGTQPGPGATSDDLVLFGRGIPILALVEATATHADATFRVRLAFDERASATFGGCQASTRGVAIRAERREQVSVAFGAEALFREAISSTAALRLAPFVEADGRGNADGVATMDELDAMPLAAARAFGEFYELPDGSRRGSFGDYVRALLRFAFKFRQVGQCVGNDPATP
jgi:hypothetical protein